MTILLFAAILTLFTTIWSIGAGAIDIPVHVIINTLFHLDGPKQPFIVMQLRLPRIVLALITGGAMAMSGTIIQAVIRNPLASPGIIGINAGAGFFAVAFALAFPGAQIVYMPFAACLGGLTAAAFVIFMAQKQHVSAAHLALIGIAVGSVFEAGLHYLLITTNDFGRTSPLIWLTGSLWGRTWAHVEASAGPLFLMGMIGGLFYYRLDLLQLGDATATGLGLNVPRMRFILLLIATFLASISVAVVGVLGFVGLMAPHMARRFVGGSHKFMLPLSTVIGMFLVVLADGIGRAIAPPLEISAGILSALIGAPFFIYIMLTTPSEEKL